MKLVSGSAQHAKEGTSQMIGLVLVTHGRLAAEFVSALEHVVGPQRNVASVCIGPEDDMEMRRNEILAAVARFVERDPGFHAFFEGLSDMIVALLPRFEAEGKSYLTVAVGCTGGRHRSVFVAERLAERLSQGGRRVNLVHRDLDRSFA